MRAGTWPSHAAPGGPGEREHGGEDGDRNDGRVDALVEAEGAGEANVEGRDDEKLDGGRGGLHTVELFHCRAYACCNPFTIMYKFSEGTEE